MRLRHLVFAAAFTAGLGAAACASPLPAEASEALLLRDASVAFAKWKDKGWKAGGHPGRHLGWQRGKHKGWAKKARHRGAYWR